MKIKSMFICMHKHIHDSIDFYHPNKQCNKHSFCLAIQNKELQSKVNELVEENSKMEETIKVLQEGKFGQYCSYSWTSSNVLVYNGSLRKSMVKFSAITVCINCLFPN